MGGLFLFALLGVILLGCLGFFIYSYIYPDFKEENLIKISSEELLKEYKTDKDGTRLKYKNKFLELSGQISYIRHDGNEYIITLDEAFECYFKYANFPLILSENSKIKIIGIFFDNGKIHGLKKCSVI